MERVYSFSLPIKNASGHKLVADLKKQSIQTGVKFSFMVIEGLKLYQEKTNGSK